MLTICAFESPKPQISPVFMTLERTRLLKSIHLMHVSSLWSALCWLGEALMDGERLLLRANLGQYGALDLACKVVKACPLCALPVTCLLEDWMYR